MNRKIAISSVSILASLALLGVGVYAADLTDATSTANTLSSTNPHLQIAAEACGTPNQTFSDSISNGLTASKIAPNHNQTVNFCLKNTGDQDLDLNVLFNATGVGNALGHTAGHLENDLSIQIACSDVTTVANSQAAGPAAFSVYESAQSLGTTPTNALTAGDTANCTLTASITVNDNAQNLVYNATFGGNGF